MQTMLQDRQQGWWLPPLPACQPARGTSRVTETRSTVRHVCRVCGEMKPITPGRARYGKWVCSACNWARQPKRTATCPTCHRSRQVFKSNGTICLSCASQARAKKASSTACAATDELIERVLATAKVQPEGCIEWPGGFDGRGYGRAQVGKQRRRAHRVVWERAVGPIPKGLCVLHRCDNPPCINPHHLWLGTKRDNTRDMMAKGRNSNGRKRGGD